MSSIDELNLQFASPDPAEALRKRLRDHRARPFHQQVVQSPWSVVYDAESLYPETKGHIVEVVDGCGEKNAVRCLTVTAPAGYGKTHLLAWNRQRLEQAKSAIFIYVPPLLDSGSFENHVLRAALDALWLHSDWQKEWLNKQVQSFLVEAYDEYIAARRPLSRLRAGSFWSRLLRPRSLRISGRSLGEQRDALQRAFRNRDLLEFAFNRFAAQNPADVEVKLDWDTFAAIAQVVCGNPAQQWHAKQWLQNEPMPPEVWAPYHLRERCQGTQKISNGLFTLMHLVGLPFCFTFDQLEDTVTAVLKREPPPWDLLALLLVRLSNVPRFSMLFFVQASDWQELSSKIPPMLHGRITQGYGAERLRSLDDAAAKAVVETRMDAFVWRELASAGITPPPQQPLFPLPLRKCVNFVSRPAAGCGISCACCKTATPNSSLLLLLLPRLSPASSPHRSPLTDRTPYDFTGDISDLK